MAKGRSGGAWLRMLAPMLVSILGLVMLRLLGPDFIDQRRLHGWLAPLGDWAPVAYVALLTVRPITLMPGQLLTAMGGMLFGTLPGALYALAGSFLASGLIFVLARTLGKRLMKRMAGERYGALQTVAKKHDFQFALLTCINPLLPTDVMLAAAASSGARFWPTVGGILLGTIPGTFLTAQFGSGLAQGRTVMTVVSAVGMVVSLVVGAFFGRRVYKEFNDAATDQEEVPAEPSAAHRPGFPLPRRASAPLVSSLSPVPQPPTPPGGAPG